MTNLWVPPGGTPRTLRFPPLSGRLATTTRAQHEGRIVGLLLGAFFVLSTAHYRLATSFTAEARPSMAALAFGLGGIGSITVLWKRMGVGQRVPLGSELMLAFFALSCVVAVLFGDQTSFAIASAGIASFLVLTFSSWRNEIRAGLVLHYAGYVLAAYVLFLFATLNIRFGSTVGFIQPNQFAKLGLAVMVLGHCGHGKFRHFSTVLAITAAVVTTSRASILFLVVFLAFYHWPRGRTNLTTTGIGLCSVALLLAAEQALGLGYLAQFGEQVLLLEDPTQGVGTGFSGRDDHWRAGLAAAWENPLGFGYNTRQGIETAGASTLNAHQGFLNLILDVGVLGLALFMAAVVVLLRSTAPHAWGNGSYAVRNSARSFVFGFLGSMLLDPVYLSVTLPLSALFLCFLCIGGPSEGREQSHAYA